MRENAYMIRSMLIHLFLLMLLISTGLSAGADLVESKTIYREEITKVYSQFLTELLQAPQDHIRAMRSLERAYQRSGDLNSLLILRDERVRFIKDPAPESIKVVDSLPKLAALQRQYVKRQKESKSARATRFDDLRKRYTGILTALQKELTKAGSIPDALAVAAELDRVKASDPLKEASRALKMQKQQKPDSRKPRSPRRSAGQLTIGMMRELLGGEVNRWHPATRRIVLKYSFTKESQLKDWKGGTFLDDKKVLVCDKTVAWLTVPFASISRIDYLAGFLGGKRARVQVGERLFADMLKKSESEAILFQSTEDHPLLSFFEKLRDDVRNSAGLEFRGGKVAWAMNYRPPREAQLQVSILYPTRIGVGHPSSKSAYDNIVIDGILTKKYVDHLKTKW